jgi:hypothetical protein
MDTSQCPARQYVCAQRQLAIRNYVESIRPEARVVASQLNGWLTGALNQYRIYAGERGAPSHCTVAWRRQLHCQRNLAACLSSDKNA